ncbi:MAG: hypothetical protein EXS01_02420 [Phycisphaerales bacterium]|nr:hypothetical protein [Phycisphaerales bacterium]
MLRTRLVVGTLLIAALAGLAMLDSAQPTLWIGFTRLGPGAILIILCLFAFAPILAFELTKLVNPGASRATFLLNYLGIFSGIASVAVFPSALAAHLVTSAAMSLPFLLVLLCAVSHARTRSVEGFARSVGALLLGYAAIGVPLGFWLLLRRDQDVWVMAGAILCVKSADIGAYFTGMALGRHKMIPWLSPGKSWEGLTGGLVCCAAVGAALGALSQSIAAADAFVDPISVGYGALVAVILGLLGTAGDLFESLLKRGAGAKDSGTILPGMGGLYDLFDSLLFAGPVAWWMLARLC